MSSDSPAYSITVDTTHHEITKEPEVLLPASVVTPQILLVASCTLAVALIAIFAVLFRRRSLSKGNALLLVGPSDAGKTSLLSTLSYHQTLPTHTSLQTNTSLVTLFDSSRLLLAVDVPGHPRIRDQFKEHLPNAKAVAFVVDASTISRNEANVAEHLHQVLHSLTSLPPSQSPPALAIIAHKYDLLKATTAAPADQLAINRVRTILERELEKRRSSHVGGVGIESLGAEGEDSSADVGGLECNGEGEFKFDHWEGGEVTFLASYVKVGKLGDVVGEKNDQEGLGAFQDWLEELR